MYATCTHVERTFEALHGWNINWKFAAALFNISNEL